MVFVCNSICATIHPFSDILILFAYVCLHKSVSGYVLYTQVNKKKDFPKKTMV